MHQSFIKGADAVFLNLSDLRAFLNDPGTNRKRYDSVVVIYVIVKLLKLPTPVRSGTYMNRWFFAKLSKWFATIGSKQESGKQKLYKYFAEYLEKRIILNRKDLRKKFKFELQFELPQRDSPGSVISVRMSTYDYICFYAIGKIGVERKGKIGVPEVKQGFFRVIRNPDNVRKKGVCWENDREIGNYMFSNVRMN